MALKSQVDDELITRLKVEEGEHDCGQNSRECQFLKSGQEGGRRRSRIVVSWDPREESVSRREQLLIPHVHIYNSRELLLPQIFTCTCTHVCVFSPSLSLPALLPPSLPLGHMFTSE